MDSALQIADTSSFGYGGHTFITLLHSIVRVSSSLEASSSYIETWIVHCRLETWAALAMADTHSLRHAWRMWQVYYYDRILFPLHLLLERSREAWDYFAMRWRLLLQRKIRLFWNKKETSSPKKHEIILEWQGNIFFVAFSSSSSSSSISYS